MNDDVDSSDAVARYLWNGALCASLQPSLHALEVTLRNSVFEASQSHVKTAGRKYRTIPCWLDVSPTFLQHHEACEVDKAIERLGTNRRYHTPGRLVAKLGFGFWTGLFRRPYDHGNLSGPRLWPSLLKQVFPSLPKHLRTRQVVADKLDDVRDFRNRIAHHEPIWDHDLLEKYDDILEALGWLNPSMRNAVRACSEVEILVHVGPGRFRGLACRLLGAEV